MWLRRLLRGGVLNDWDPTSFPRRLGGSPHSLHLLSNPNLAGLDKPGSKEHGSVCRLEPTHSLHLPMNLGTTPERSGMGLHAYLVYDSKLRGRGGRRPGHRLVPRFWGRLRSGPGLGRCPKGRLRGWPLGELRGRLRHRAVRGCNPGIDVGHSAPQELWRR